MKKTLRDIFRLLRPRQWIKNFAIFAVFIFSGEILNVNLVSKVCFGFLVFCLISSAIYVINDIFDIKKDRLHPFKKFRPLANGDISKPQAIVIAIILLIISLIGSYLVSPAFFIITLIYFIMQFSYTILLKHIEIIDILTLAGGYILRVIAGEVVTAIHTSAWLILTVIALSLFLAIGKRRSELTLLASRNGTQALTVRKTLSHYSEKLLDVYLSIFATSTFISYALFTFQENPRGVTLNTDLIPADILGTYLQRKWLMITIIPVAYGLMRYLQRIYEKHEGESPERVLFSDRPLLISVLVWVVMTIGILYFVRP